MIQVVIGIPRLYRPEIWVGGPFAQQIIQHLRDGSIQHLRAFHIVVFSLGEHGNAVALQLFLHIFFRIEFTVVFDDGIQHVPGVFLTGIVVPDVIHPVGIRDIGGILTHVQQRVIQLLLCFRNDFFHIAV